VRAFLVPLEGGRDIPPVFAIFVLLGIITPPMDPVWNVVLGYTRLEDYSLLVVFAPPESTPRMGSTARAVPPVDSLHQVIKHLANLVEMEDTLIRDQLDHRMIVVLAQQVFIRHPTQVLNAPCVLLASGVRR
jgi:hypothetical protein